MFQVKRTLSQFTPAHWDKDEWHPLLGPWRFIQVLCLCIVFLTVELNTFFLKFCLWIPPRNPLIAYRLILWWLIAIPTIREYNSYLQDRYTLSSIFSQCAIDILCWLKVWVELWALIVFYCLLIIARFFRKPAKKVGTFCWLSVAICIVELFICIKFGHGTFSVLFFIRRHYGC